MIKYLIKSVLLLGIITLGIINFSNASWFGHGVVGNYSTSPNNTDYDVMIARYWEFNTQMLGSTKRVFSPNQDSMFYWNIDGYLHGTDNWGFDGIVKNYYVCDYVNGDFSSFSNCSKYSYTGGNIDIVNNMLSFVKVGDRFFYGSQLTRSVNYLFHAVNISDLNKTVVFAWGGCRGRDQANCLAINGDNGYMGLDISENDLTRIQSEKWAVGLQNLDLNNGYVFGTIPNNIIGVSPVYTGGSDSGGGVIDGGISIGSQESAINYFESNYGRDSSICYVGINNSTDLWGTSVSFQEGSGLTIFQLYDQLYGTGDLNHYYVFVNNWLLNYEQWFNTSGDPMYLSNYNSGTNQVELYYDNLSFPFANNPIALYFMSNNISLKSPGSTMGSEVVSYCNLKLNDGTFEEIIDQSSKNNITNYTENSNKNKGYNSDGTKKTTDYSQFGGNTGNSNSGSGNLSLSGVELAFSGNTSLQNTLTNFIDYVKTITNYNAGSSTTGIIPRYILMGLIFVVLFKFLRRR